MKGYTVFISSTDADLHDLRAVVGDGLKRKGFEVQAFDDPDFKPLPGFSAPEACVRAASSCDILILIIDRRYGSRYRGGSLSVTEAEYNAAFINDRFVIPCIRLRTWMEASFQQGTQIELETWLRQHYIPEYDWPELNTSYVDEPEVIRFVERIKKQDKNNFITFFDSPIDLERKLESRLRAIGVALVRQFILQGSIQVGSTRIATLGMDLLGMQDLRRKGLYVNPPFVVEAGERIRSQRLIERIMGNLVNQRASIVLIGAPGSGKSTLLMQTVLIHSSRYLAGQTTVVPLFINLKGRGGATDRSIVGIFDEQWQSYLGRRPYPLVDISRFECVAYLDSLDEIVSDPSQFDFEDFLASAEYFNLPYMVACREGYFRGYALGASQRRLYNAVIKLIPWGMSEIRAFLINYSRSKPQFDPGFVLKTIEEQQLQAFVELPLLLSFIVTLIDERVDLSAIKHPVEVFQLIISKWADRESKRRSGDYSAMDLEDLWRKVAWMMLKSSIGITLDDIALTRHHPVLCVKASRKQISGDPR